MAHTISIGIQSSWKFVGNVQKNYPTVNSPTKSTQQPAKKTR